MTEQEINANNRLIAEFMTTNDGKLFVSPDGWRLKQYDANGKEKIIDFDDDEVNGLKYNSSWDWLMPVVEKMEGIGVSTDLHYFAGLKGHSAGFCFTVLGYKYAVSAYDATTIYEKKFDALYNGVIKFIKWYDKNEKK